GHAIGKLLRCCTVNPRDGAVVARYPRRHPKRDRLGGVERTDHLRCRTDDAEEDGAVAVHPVDRVAPVRSPYRPPGDSDADDAYEDEDVAEGGHVVFSGAWSGRCCIACSGVRMFG